VTDDALRFVVLAANRELAPAREDSAPDAFAERRECCDIMEALPRVAPGARGPGSAP
jgi:hypothetical protein